MFDNFTDNKDMSVLIKEQVTSLIGENYYELWDKLCSLIESKYDMEKLWGLGGKAWNFEYKYRRGGKTLCSLCVRNNCFGFVIIFGRIEREKFEANRNNYSLKMQQIYDDARTYHDGKWLLLEICDTSLFADIENSLEIKRKPNKK